LVIPVYSGLAALLQFNGDEMIDEYIGKTLVSPLDFGQITERQVLLAGKFIITPDNSSVWNSALSEIHQTLRRLGLQG
jgi:hypothetical protein